MYYDQVNDIYLVSKMGQIIKIQRPVCDIRGRIYNSVAGDIIVQIDITGLIISLLLTLNITVNVTCYNNMIVQHTCIYCINIYV